MSEPVEFSRIVKVETLPRDGLTQKIVANEIEREKLSKRFSLDSMQSLEADFVIRRSGKGVRVTGEARAKVMQICVVTLEPFPAEVVEDIDVRFAPPPDPRRKPPALEEEIRFDAEDEPDPLIDGAVDLGELAAEFIALGLDPYPRKPEAKFEAPAEEEPASPFAKLRLVKDGERESD
jgi:uncharacterized metal-binding protein YceD (DUF177 family)